MTLEVDLERYPGLDEALLPAHFTPRRHPHSDGPIFCDFAETFLSVTKGRLAGNRLDFRPWQRWMLDGMLERRPDGRLRYRVVLVGLPRKNGKSLVGSAVALYGLYAGEPGAEVYSIAGDRQQAKVVFDEAKHQVRNSEALLNLSNVFKDAIEVPTDAAVYRVLSHDGKLAQGLNPSMVVADEVHVYPNEELWVAMTLGSAARLDPLVLAITTAGNDPDSLAGKLYDYGLQVESGEVDDETFGFFWWEAPEGSDHMAEDVWRIANPNLVDGLLDLEDFVAAAKQTSETAFRRYRLNQWVRAGGAAWMGQEDWDLAQLPHAWQPPDGAPTVLGFDGSVSRDATALVAITLVRDQPIAWVPGIWEPGGPQGQGAGSWQVPRAEVTGAIAECFERYDVIALGADPAYWRSELQEWGDRFGHDRVIEWPVTNARAGPAVAATYARLRSGRLFHDGDPRLRRHVLNARVRSLGPQGETIAKVSKDSGHWIDGAMALCIAVDVLERFEAPAPKRPGHLVTF